MLIKHSLCVVSLCVLLVAPPALLAQATHPIDEVRENARSHIGPFYITPGLVLRDLGIDNNVFNEAQDPKSDFSFMLGPKADIAIPLAHRVLLRSTVAADFVYYKKYSSERSVNPSVSPQVTIFFNRLSFFGEGSYLRSRRRPNYEIDTRSLRTESSLGGGIGYQFSPKLGFQVSGRQSKVEYDVNETYQSVSLQQTLNRKSDTYATAVKYAITPLTTIVLKADQSQDRFEFSPERDADTLRITPGVEFNALALITGSAYVGVRRFNTKSPALEDFKGVVASASLGYTLLGRTIFTVNGNRDVTYSFELNRPYFVVDSYGLTVRQRLAGNFDIMVGANRSRYTYRNFALTDPVATTTLTSPAKRVDVTRNYSISLGYLLAPDVRLAFGTTYWHRESNSFQDRDYDALRTGVSLQYGF